MTELSLLNRTRPLGCEAIQMFGAARLEHQLTIGASGVTQEFAFELMARHDKAATMPRLIAAQGRATSSPAAAGCFADAAFAASFADLDNAWAGVTGLWTGNGGASVVPGLTTSRGAYVYTDRIPSPPVARSDGGVRPILAGRSFAGAGGVNVAQLGKSVATAADFTNWKNRAAGKARFRDHNTAGDQRSASNWAATSTEVSRAMLVGAVFTHDGPVANVMSLSDSELAGEGGGNTYAGEGMGLLACEAINALTPNTWMVHSGLAWSGQISAAVQQRLIDLISYGIIPDILVFMAGSPNDTPNLGDPITTTVVNGWRAATGEILAICAENDICPIIIPVLPSDYSVHQWGSTDSLRRSYNTEIRALANRGVFVADLDTAFSGAVDGNGQATFNASYSTDLVHANDTGKAVGAALIQTEILKAVGGYL